MNSVNALTGYVVAPGIIDLSNKKYKAIHFSVQVVNENTNSKREIPCVAFGTKVSVCQTLIKGSLVTIQGSMGSVNKIVEKDGFPLKIPAVELVVSYIEVHSHPSLKGIPDTEEFIETYSPEGMTQLRKEMDK